MLKLLVQNQQDFRYNLFQVVATAQIHTKTKCGNNTEEHVFLSFTLHDGPVGLAGLDTQGKWDPCVNNPAADQVSDPPFFANWHHSLAPHTHR